MHSGFPHVFLTVECVRHVSFLPKQFVGLVVNIVVKSVSCARKNLGKVDTSPGVRN